jgi:hypothetical protein
MMPGPSWENNQLVPYLLELNAVPGKTRGDNVPNSPWWQQYPVMYSSVSNYGAMSTATNTNNQPAADTTAGNVVADAGFGGFQQ